MIGEARAARGHNRPTAANRLWPAGTLARLVGALVFALALGFGIHQLLDLRRERRKREAAERQTRDG